MGKNPKSFSLETEILMLRLSPNASDLLPLSQIISHSKNLKFDQIYMIK
jgi:hypothetical protein